jgi:predicted transcriptional regulator
MAKSVRLSDYLYTEIERLARAEKRSLANMVKVLLEQALGMERAGFTRIKDAETEKVVGVTLPPDDSHFKPDFGSKLK